LQKECPGKESKAKNRTKQRLSPQEKTFIHQ